MISMYLRALVAMLALLMAGSEPRYPPSENLRVKPRVLRPGGEPIAGSIAGGDVVTFAIGLPAGEFVVFHVRQSAINLEATLSGPLGAHLATADTPFRTTGEETIEAVVEQPGAYLLTIRPKEADAPKGVYQVRADPIRRASAADRSRVAALRVFERAERLRGEGTRESLAKALATYDRALAMFRAMDDRRGEAATLLRTADVLGAQGYLKRGPDKYREALERFRALDDPAGVAEALSGEGSAHDEAVRLSRLTGDASLEGYALLNQASSVYWDRQYKQYKPLVEQAAALFRRVNDRRGLASAIRGIGLAVQELQTPSDAMPLFLETLSIGRSVGDLNIEAIAMGSIAWASRYLGKPQDMIDAYSRGMELAHRSGNQLIEAWQTRALGQAYAQVGHYAKALTYYERALPLEREIEVQMDHGVTLGAMGKAYTALGDSAKGLDYRQQSLRVFQKLKDPQEEAFALLSLGEAYEDLGRTEEALEQYTPALRILRDLGDRRREGWVLTRLGGFYAERGDYRQALEVTRQALESSRAVVDGQGAVRALARLADIHRLLGQPQQSVEVYEQALATARRNGLKSEEATVLVKLGYAFSDQGSHDRARQRYEEALALARATDTSLRVVESAALEGLGGTRRSTGDTAGAIAAYKESLSIAQALADHAREVDALNGLGQALVASGDVPGALSTFVDALQRAREGKLVAPEALALRNLMTAWRITGRPAVATFYGKQAVNMFQTVRANILELEPQTQRAYLRSKETVYRELADLLVTQGRLPEAQQVLDFLKELEFRDYLRRGPSASDGGKVELTPEERTWEERYFEISERVVSLGQERRRLENQRLRTPEDNARLARLDEDLRVAGQAYRRFIDTLATELGTGRESAERVFQLREAQALMGTLRALRNGTVALYTIVSERRYTVMLITPDVQVAREFAIPAADLRQKVLAFRDVLKDHSSDPRPLAQELYAILVGPVAQDLQQADARTLMLSLDDVLRYLPLGALHDGKEYLVERYRTTLFSPASRDHLKDSSQIWRNGLGVGVSKPVQGFSPLPAVEEELRGIFRGSPGQPRRGVLAGRVLLDEAFTESALREQLRQRPPVVHVASHFQFRPGNENDSFLLLGDGRRLSVADLASEFSLFSGVDLLTLSACDTAVGGAGATGKEVESFGMLAQRKGARSVIATLWPVADQSTRVLMERFYRSRVGNTAVSKAEALQRAQLTLLKGTSPGTVGDARGLTSTSFVASSTAPYAHPYFWAPFLLIGNGN